jgi:hypothetical protein
MNQIEKSHVISKAIHAKKGRLKKLNYIVEFERKSKNILI